LRYVDFSYVGYDQTDKKSTASTLPAPKKIRYSVQHVGVGDDYQMMRSVGIDPRTREQVEEKDNFNGRR
jgi:hypothetical protein